MEELDALSQTVHAIPRAGFFEKYLLDSYKYVFLSETSLLHEKSAPFGEECFRRAIANFLNDFYGIKTNAENIVIGSGSENLLWYILRLKSLSVPLVKSSGKGLFKLATQISDGSATTIQPSVAVSETTNFRIRKIFTDLSIPVREIPVDDMGMSFDFLVTSGATIAFVTPSDVPALSFAEDYSNRRIAMVDWASEVPYRHIIELDTSTVSSLSSTYKSKDKDNKVIYINSFSNLLCKGINASFAVLPDDILADYKSHYADFECTLPKLTQLALSHFVSEGHLIKYLSDIEQI